MSEKLVTVGIDLALRSKHKAVALVSGESKAHYLRPFRTEAGELTALLEQIRGRVGEDSRIEFIMEPTSNAWFPLARWLKGQGQAVYLMRPERSADLRRYLSKHTKTDTIDGKTLAWAGQHDRENFFPARLQSKEHNACFRLCKQRARHSKEVAKIKTRIRDLVELAAPGLYEILQDPFTHMGRMILQRYLDPHRTARLGLKRFSKICQQASWGRIEQEKLEKLYQVFVNASQLYRAMEGETAFDLDFELLQEEVVTEMEHLKFLEAKIKKLDGKIEKLYAEIDSRKVLTSIQGIGPTIGAAITSKVGKIDDFKNLAAFRSFCGLIPRKKQSSETDRKGMKITKAGNRYLKMYLYMAAEAARHWDPEFANFYARLVYDGGKHHKKAIVALANKLAGRVYAVLKRAACNPEGDGVFYQLRNLKGEPISKSDAKKLTEKIMRDKKKEEPSTGTT